MKVIEQRIGKVKDFKLIKSLYTSDYVMLKYFLTGEKQNINKYIYIYLYYKNDEEFKVKKVELQDIEQGTIIRVQ